MKLAFVVLVVSILGNFHCHSHHLFLGEITWMDRHAFSTNVTEPFRFLRVVTKYIDYPVLVFSFNNNCLNTIYFLNFFIPQGIISYRPISAIRAIDLNSDGNGANVTIINGGINSTSVQLKFKSKRNHGIHFKLDIYTKW